MSDSEFDEILNVPTFRDLVDEPELLALLSDDKQELVGAVRALVDRCLEDGEFQGRLADTVETAIEEGCGEEQAVLWIVAALAETRSQAAIHTLLRSFAMEEEEESLSGAAGIALLRIGVPAIEALMEWIDEEPGVDLRKLTYRLLGDCGVLDEQGYIQDVKEFLRSRVLREQLRDPGDRALEDAAAASARLGDVDFLDKLREIFTQSFEGRNASLQDSIELLEENPDGVPFVPTISAWEESYGWLFEEDLESHRVNRPEAEEEAAHHHHHDHDCDDECGQQEPS